MTSITLNGDAFTFTYDANGNLASKSGPTSSTTTYSWNARNQLTAISGPAGNASFKYDAMGRRIEKTVNGNTTGFLYDGAQAIAELKGSALDAVYHTGLQIDEVLARYGASGNKTLLTDALMSVIAQANDDHSIQNFYVYSPYGEAQILGPDDGNSLQFTGRENDGTGLYYYRARYYDPLLKRFISEDPIGIAGGLNSYGYVGGDPVNLIDPTGNASTCFSAGPGCSGAGNGIVKTPPGGGCYTPIMRGGYILRWEPCSMPPTPQTPSTPICPSAPQPPAGTSGPNGSAPGNAQGSSRSTSSSWRDYYSQDPTDDAKCYASCVATHVGIEAAAHATLQICASIPNPASPFCLGGAIGLGLMSPITTYMATQSCQTKCSSSIDFPR